MHLFKYIIHYPSSAYINTYCPESHCRQRLQRPRTAEPDLPEELVFVWWCGRCWQVTTHRGNSRWTLLHRLDPACAFSFFFFCLNQQHLLTRFSCPLLKPARIHVKRAHLGHISGVFTFREVTHLLHCVSASTNDVTFQRSERKLLAACATAASAGSFEQPNELLLMCFCWLSLQTGNMKTYKMRERWSWHVQGNDFQRHCL